MWSQWCFSLHLTGTFGAFREYENVLSCKIVQKKKCKCYLRRMLETCVNVRGRVLCSIQCVEILSFNVSVEEKEKPPFILMLFSSNVALSVFYPSLSWSQMDTSAEGRRWQFMCTCLLKDIQKCVVFCFCFFHFICKIYLPYSGFYCGIIPSGVIIQYCTILFKLLTKKYKV